MASLLLRSNDFIIYLTFPTETDLSSPAFAFTIMDCINQGGVVPVLDHIVWSIMDLNFNGVTTIVYQKNNRILTPSQHC